ncbi:hypothetical protein BV20DRAFT_857487 [Pilatotrama ljubarskyi]|nr:hypothetical protein BV20DRAFT_857487 [Pilatotrama ljubarskyi]
MDLISLNEDVLHGIVSMLSGEDALSLSLTSRRMHDLAIHRVAAVIVCKDGRELRLLHRYLFFGSRPRGQDLERFSLYKDDGLRLDSEAWFARPEAPLETLDEESFYDWSRLNIILDILVNAPNLRHVKLPLLHPALEHDPRLRDALRALSRLVSLNFDTVGDTTLMFIQSLHCLGLRQMVLEFHCGDIAGRYRIRGEPVTFTILVETLARFPSLQTLRLELFRPRTSFFDEHGYTPHLFPTLRSLDLWGVSPQALDLVQLCPGVSSIDFRLHEVTLPNDSTLSSTEHRAGARWPTLRSLTFASLVEAVCAQNLVNEVHRLHIRREELDVAGPGGRSLPVLLEILRGTSPVGLYLSLAVRPEPMAFWDEVAAVAPRLRFLELKMTVMSLSLDHLGWLDRLPGALRPLPLVSLRIFLPRLSDGNRPYASGQKVIVKRLERDRDESAETLPQRLASAIPTLRFVAISAEGPSTTFCDTFELDDEEGPDGVSESVQEVQEEEPERRLNALSLYDKWGIREGDTLPFDRKLAYLRWWRVRPNGNDRRLEEMSQLEGERVQSFLNGSDFAAVSRIGESLS